MDRIVMEGPIKNEFPITGLTTIQRKRQVRFSARHDILLLREVIVQNPFASKETGKVWARVGEIITAALQDENFEVDARRCRERTMLLLDYYKKQDFASLRRFGTERLYAQKEDLLHEVLELEAERGRCLDEELSKRAIEELTLLEQEKSAVTHTANTTDVEEEHEEIADLSGAPTAKRACQCCCQTYSEILSKIALERERLGAEKRERERRFELESQERQVILDLLKEKLLKG
ncbi:hypothetical protein WMY93_006319 [Mugilogobius chulae]|uniref:Uncharacterized protein n=1 Tax=Mugilogobius chulae TaxID=88201 RepID=A0AAW0PMP1_9GOBI